MREDLSSLQQSNAALLAQLNEQSSYFNVHMVELQRVIKHLEDHAGSVDRINHDLRLENESLKKKMAGERARYERALRDKEEECAQMFGKRMREIEGELEGERQAFTKVVDELMEVKA